jgi:hypothetical protein
VTEDGQTARAVTRLEAAGQGKYSLAYQSALAKDSKGHTVQVAVSLPDGRTASDKTTITPPPNPLPWWENPWVIAGVLGGVLALIAGLLLWHRHQGRQWTWVYRCMDCGHNLADEQAPCPCGSTKKPFRARVRRKDVILE